MLGWGSNPCMRCPARAPGLHRPRRKHSSACGHTPCRKPVQEVQQGTYQPAAGRFKSENLDGASPYSPQPQELPAWTKSLARIFVLDETRVPGSESFRMGRSVTPRGWSGRSSRMRTSSGRRVCRQPFQGPAAHGSWPFQAPPGYLTLIGHWSFAIRHSLLVMDLMPYRRILRYRVRRSIPKMAAVRIWCHFVRCRIAVM